MKGRGRGRVQIEAYSGLTHPFVAVYKGIPTHSVGFDRFRASIVHWSACSVSTVSYKLPPPDVKRGSSLLFKVEIILSFLLRRLEIPLKVSHRVFLLAQCHFSLGQSHATGNTGGYGSVISVDTRMLLWRRKQMSDFSINQYVFFQTISSRKSKWVYFPSDTLLLKRGSI